MVEVLQMAQSCTICGDGLQAYTKFLVAPKVYALDMSASNAQVNIDHSIEVPGFIHHAEENWNKKS
jgi:hypothetical protein